MTVTPKRPQLSAEAAYENTHLAAQDLLERIRELLLDLPAPGNEEPPIDWTQVGTLTEVNHRLAAVVAFLEGSARSAEPRAAAPRRPVVAGRARRGQPSQRTHC